MKNPPRNFSQKIVIWLHKFFFVTVLFLLTDKFYRLTDILSRKPEIRHIFNTLANIPMKDTTYAFRFLWRGVISAYFLDAALVFVLLALVFNSRVRDRMKTALSRNAGIILLVLLAFTSLLWTVDSRATWEGAWRVLTITVVAFYVSQVFSSDEVLEMLVWVACLGGLASLLGAWGVSELRTDFFDSAGWNGIYSYKNIIGRLMAFGNVMLIIYWIRNAGSFQKRAFAVLMFMVTGAEVLLTDSVTSILVLAGVYVSLVFYWGWNLLGSYRKGYGRWLLAGAFIVVVSLVAWKYQIILSALNRSSSLSGRFEIWQILWSWLLQRPALGFGYQAFWSQFPDGLRIQSASWIVIVHAHNGYMEIAVALGLAGLAVFIFSLLASLKHSFDLLKQKQQVTFLWTFLALVYFIVANLTYSVGFVSPEFSWALFVIVSGVVAVADEKTKPDPSS